MLTTMLTTSAPSILRQTGRLSWHIEVPSLVIVLGCLMLLGQLLHVPAPSMLVGEGGADEPEPAGYPSESEPETNGN